MGGFNESTVPQAESAPIAVPPQSEEPHLLRSKAASSHDLTIRMHQSNGQVHFHADDVGLKCAVPIGEWYNIWSRLRSKQVPRASFLDVNTGVRARFVGIMKPGDIYDIRIKLDKYAYGTGEMYQALQKVSGG